MGKYAEVCGKEPTKQDLEKILEMLRKYLSESKEEASEFSLSSGTIVKTVSGVEDIFKAIFFKTPKYDFYLRAADPSQYKIKEFHSLSGIDKSKDPEVVAKSLKVFLEGLDKHFPFTRFSSISVRNLWNIDLNEIKVKEQKDGYSIVY